MKKLFTFAMVAFIGSTLLASSPGTTPAVTFSDDLTRFDSDFAGMSALEQLVEERNASYTELAAENNSLLNTVTNDNNIAGTLLGGVAPGDDRLLGIPGFWWGFCLGLLGVILVYVAVDGDAKKTEGRSAIIGCAIWTVLWVLLYLVIWGAWAASLGW